MKNSSTRIAICGVLVILQAANAQSDVGDSDQSRPAWNNIDVIRENAETPRAHFVPYRSR